MSFEQKPKVTVILANLGTPDEATVPAVRRFLKQFLSDSRVIEIPKLIWWIILNLFVLPFRPKRVAHAYASVWSADSPMREIVFEQTQRVQAYLERENKQFDLTVLPAMTYGNPGIDAVLEKLATNPQEHVILLPLFPQYSATSTAPLYDAFAKWIPTQRNLPGLTIIKDYYQHPMFIQALAESVLAYQEQHGKPEKLLMSFHGIPQPYADKGDPYADRCRITAQLVAEALHLNDDEWAISFQSRFGKQEWVKPYTDQLLQDWAQQGIKSIQVLSPAFSADCLETLEELAIQNAELFQQAGGGSYAYIPALNSDQAHIDLLAGLVQANLDALTHTLAHR
ncbi:ferrochelatase [Acinetobacter sp. AOR15_HL]|uniref:ferrochelatase n=1 Tax=unclassified Acinetobacter TaxID=196816 RepID=UPI0022EB787C|nr:MULTISPECIES: ferrochelatase [unclassified Acinetobacter]MDA3558254.1 ferrochelatase [Acinetobacter sp. AOR15_HL]MDA3572048.1 ferrochelatase [Acinetobacter sp. AOR14_HL]